MNEIEKKRRRKTQNIFKRYNDILNENSNFDSNENSTDFDFNENLTDFSQSNLNENQTQSEDPDYCESSEEEHESEDDEITMEEENVPDNIINESINTNFINLPINVDLNTSIEEKSKLYKININTLQYKDSDWNRILYDENNNNITNEEKVYLKENLILNDVNNNENYKIEDFLIFLISLKTKKKISFKIINIILNIVHLFFKPNKKLPKSINKIMKDLSIKKEFKKIIICEECSHIIIPQSETQSEKNLLCPICKNISKNYILFNSLKNNLIEKFKNSTFCKDFNIAPIINNDFENQNEEYNYLNSDFSKKLIKNFKNSESSNLESSNLFCLLSGHLDGIMLSKKSNSVESFLFEILSNNPKKIKSNIILNMLKHKSKSKNFNTNLISLIILKELKMLTNGVKFKGANNEEKTLYADLLLIKGDIPAIHQITNIRSEKVACSKCTGVTKLNETIKIIDDIEKKKKKYNWNIKKFPKRNVVDAITNFKESIDFEGDPNFFITNQNLFSISPLIELYQITGFDYFINSIGMELLHNSSGIFSKILKLIPKKSINNLNGVIKMTTTSKDFTNQALKPINSPGLNSSDLIEIYNHLGRVWFRLINNENEKIKKIIALMDIKFRIIQNLIKFSNIDELENLLNEEKSFLIV
jgi:hypothetical protein